MADRPSNSTAAGTGATPAAIGRFQVRRALGRGAQATVWLAFDTRLEREVAVKWMNQTAALSDRYDWRREARSVARLSHPNIVPVYEADQHEGRPFLVFEYVAGSTLAERLRQRGAYEPRAAVHTMLGVLEALQAAHGAGIVHRDLKPSNILLDAGGRARVMDFGIAGLMHEAIGADELVVGTPGYLSPEAARGEAATPAMDVYSAGLLLIEMLSGERVIQERDPQRALQRAASEDIRLPERMGANVDDVLRGVLMRAIARDRAARLPDAGAFHAALSQWLNPAPEAEGSAGQNSATLDFLLRRMRHRTDFPAMSDSIARIQRIAADDDQSLNSLAAEVSHDVALTNKLLRLVNTAQFSHAGGGSIGTVLRAVALVGFAGIRNIALSLVLLERMQDKAHAGQLKEEYLRALMAGMLANELASTSREGEEVFVGAMFQNLGRLLTEYYLVDEARQIRDLVHPPAARPPMSETQAAISVLGIGYDELGRGVARHWGLPENLQRCMSRPEGEPPARTSGVERMRWLSRAANDIAASLLETEPAKAQARIQVIGERYAKALGVAAKDVQQAVDRSRERLQQTARALDISLGGASPARRLMRDAAADASAAGAQLHDASHAPTAPAALHDAPTAELPPGSIVQSASAQRLSAGIQAITDSMAGDGFRLNDVLRMVLETMHEALGFRVVVFSLRDPKTDTLTGRYAIGESADVVKTAFRVPLRTPAGREPDLFTSLCLKGLDSVIADATTPTITARLPAWFRDSVGAPAFLVLPLMVKSAPFAMIYADKRTPGAMRFTPQELAQLGTLRNQVLMAFRQGAA